MKWMSTWSINKITVDFLIKTKDIRIIQNLNIMVEIKELIDSLIKLVVLINFIIKEEDFNKLQPIYLMEFQGKLIGKLKVWFLLWKIKKDVIVVMHFR